MGPAGELPGPGPTARGLGDTWEVRAITPSQEPLGFNRGVMGIASTNLRGAEVRINLASLCEFSFLLILDQQTRLYGK